MGKQRRIKPVTDNIDKQQTYIEQNEQLNKALENKFYFEAIMIEYAMLEDRMKSFIYHTGGLDNRLSYQLDVDKTKPHIEKIVKDYKTRKDNGNLDLGAITAKEAIINCLCRWAKDDNKKLDDSNEYLSVLNEQLKSRIDPDDLLSLIDRIDVWRDFRNEFVHTLMNKNLEDMRDKLSVQAIEGKKLVKEISKYVNRIKYYGKIRKTAGLEVD